MRRSVFSLLLIGFLTSIVARPVGQVHAKSAGTVATLAIYVNGGGGRLVEGRTDDALRGVSSAVKNAGLPHADIPAFEGTPSEWRAILSCAREHFVGLPVVLTDAPPTGDFLMLMVGGRAADLGQVGYWGWSTFGDHRVVERGVGFVFSADHRVPDRAAALCQTVAHEIGHMLGLAHVDNCRDLMSGNRACQRVGFLAPNRQLLSTSLARWVTETTHLAAGDTRPIGRAGRGQAARASAVRGEIRVASRKTSARTRATRAPSRAKP